MSSEPLYFGRLKIPKNKLTHKNLREYLLQFCKEGSKTFRSNEYCTNIYNGFIYLVNISRRREYHRQADDARLMHFYHEKDISSMLFFNYEMETLVTHLDIKEWNGLWPERFLFDQQLPSKRLDRLGDQELGVDLRLCYLLNTGAGVNIYRTRQPVAQCPFYYKIENAEKPEIYVYQSPFDRTRKSAPSYRAACKKVKAAQKSWDDCIKTWANFNYLMLEDSPVRTNDTFRRVISGDAMMSIPFGEFATMIGPHLDWLEEQQKTRLIPLIQEIQNQFMTRISRHHQIRIGGLAVNKNRDFLSINNKDSSLPANKKSSEYMKRADAKRKRK